MRTILELLRDGRIIVGDGAMGTMLFQRGLRGGECPELWNLTKPEVIEEITELYIRAGAEIVQTNTFGASPAKLANYGLENRCEEINRAGISIAKKAAAKPSREVPFISGSCGPSGKILKPYGDADADDLYDGFLRQMKILVGEGADIICVETMIDLQEAMLAVRAAKSISPRLPVIATMTFDETPRGFYTIMGVSISEACAGLEKAGADIIGSNCGNGIEKMGAVAREFKKNTSLPIVIQSNAGLPESRNGHILYSETPQFFAEKTKELIDAGVRVIGGCCGTTPDHIRAIKETVSFYR